jgi:hypothetical protein
MAKHLERVSLDAGFKCVRLRFDDPKLGPRIVRLKTVVRFDGKHLLLEKPTKRLRPRIAATAGIGLVLVATVTLFSSPKSPKAAVTEVACEVSLFKTSISIAPQDVKLGGVSTKRVLCNNEPYRITVDSVRGKVIGVKKL